MDNWGRCLWKGFEDYIMMYFDCNWGRGLRKIIGEEVWGRSLGKKFVSRILCTRDPNPNPNYDIRDAELAAKLAAMFVGMLGACK